MARIVLPVVGAVVGYFVGGPVGAQYGWLVGSVAGALVGTQTRKTVRANETGAQTTTEGSPRAIVYGAAPVTGNLIDTGPIRKVETTEEAKGGGGPTSTSIQYFRTFAIRICEGPIGGILVIKRDGAVIYDVRPGSDFAEDNARILEGARLYLGDETQLPDPALEAIHGVGNVPAHRGSAYMVVIDSDLTNRQGSVPQYEFVVAQEATPDVIDLTPVGSTVVFGEFGGGTFDGHTVTGFFDTTGGGGITGSMFLAYFGFTASGGPWPLTITVQVDGAPVWTESIIVTTTTTNRVQLNHARDHSQVDLIFTGHFEGSLSMSLEGLQGADPYASIRPRTDTLDLIESDEADFGVGVNTTAYIAAIYLSVVWRVSLTYPLGTLTPGVPTLGSIVEDIHDRCTASVPDVSELDDDVAGLVFGSADYCGADAIETLRAPYFFDRAEYDGQIHYPKRGADSVATIDIDDLVEIPDESRREAAPEYPRKMHLQYQAVQVNYEIAQATSDRYSTDARVTGEISFQVPVVLDEQGAANTVTRLHKVAWADAEGEVTFSLPMQWFGLTPAENLLLNLRNRTRRLRIEKIEDNDGVRALTCRIDRQTAYLSEAPSFIPLPTPPAPPSFVPGDTVLAMMDIAALRDIDDVLTVYFAGTGANSGWRGFQLQRSLDDGATFVAVQSVSAPSVIGTLVASVADASEFYTDTTNTVQVALIRDGQELTSISDLAFVQRGGAFALEKSDGSWEIMQYRDAEVDTDGVFTLSTLHRGLLNSGTSAHSSGALFVLLNTSRLEAAEGAWLTADLTHRGVSMGTSPEDADEQTLTYVGRSQTEWPVASLALARDGGDVLTGTWAPRHRLGSDVYPVASVNFRGYRITIDDGVLDPVVFDVTDDTFTYDASALGAPVDVTVQALNRFTGAGPATTDSI